VPKAVYRSGCRDKHNCRRCGSNLGSFTPESDALTTRLLRPAEVAKTNGDMSFRGHRGDTLLLCAASSKHGKTGSRTQSAVTVAHTHIHTHTHTHTFNGLFSGTTQVSRYQKGRTSLDFAEARDSEWQWHQLGQMQVYTSLQTDNHAQFFTCRMPFLPPNQQRESTESYCSNCGIKATLKSLPSVAESPQVHSVIGSLCRVAYGVLLQIITSAAALINWRLVGVMF